MLNRIKKFFTHWGKWHHFAATSETVDGKLVQTIFVDGEKFTGDGTWEFWWREKQDGNRTSVSQ